MRWRTDHVLLLHCSCNNVNLLPAQQVSLSMPACPASAVMDLLRPWCGSMLSPQSKNCGSIPERSQAPIGLHLQAASTSTSPISAFCRWCNRFVASIRIYVCASISTCIYTGWKQIRRFRISISILTRMARSSRFWRFPMIPMSVLLSLVARYLHSSWNWAWCDASKVRMQDVAYFNLAVSVK